MNREQVKKGLRNFITNAHTKIYYPGGDDLIGDALSLINELTEEIERLKATKYMAHSDGRIETIPTIESVRANTVREMQERLKAQVDRSLNVFDFNISECNAIRQVLRGLKNDIDQIAKEMLEVNDGRTKNAN